MNCILLKESDDEVLNFSFLSFLFLRGEVCVILAENFLDVTFFRVFYINN